MNDLKIIFEHIIYNDDFIKILASTVVGTLIGLEREYRGKSAGLRTFALISIGSTIFTILSEKMGVATSPDRIAANIVTGIGFLGAGIIYKIDDRVPSGNRNAFRRLRKDIPGSGYGQSGGTGRCNVIKGVLPTGRTLRHPQNRIGNLRTLDR